MTLPPSFPPPANRRRRGATPAPPPATTQANPPSFPPSATRPTRAGGPSARPSIPKPPTPQAPRQPERHSIIDKQASQPAPTQPPSIPPKRRSPQPPAFAPARTRPAATEVPQTRPAPRTDRPEPGLPPHGAARPEPKRRRRRGRRLALAATLLLVVALVAWPLYLLNWANNQISHTQALSGQPNVSGTTWLIAGSDRRSDGSDGGIADPTTEGARTDSLMLVRRVGGTAMVVSLPRDAAVEIPGHGLNKINAAYALGGAPLLVLTVENLTGVTVDHYVEVSMGAVTQIVDAVGGVELCSDLTVNDRDSQLVWQPGCHTVDGKTALAFARMRKSDPLGDIGRADRQRQVIAKTVNAALSPASALNPLTQRSLGGAVAQSLITDPDTGVVSLGLLAWNYRSAQGAGLTGAPPISNLNYRDGRHGSMVQLDPNRIAAFWSAFGSGTLTPGDYHRAS